MFFITTCDHLGIMEIAETFYDADDAMAALNALKDAQEDRYSYRRQLAINELSEQLEDHFEALSEA